MSDFEELGGMDRLRTLMDDFVSRVFDDVMIGFLFRNASRERVAQMETLFAARMLGAQGIEYPGKSIREAHAPHPIMGGQFMRRQTLLKQTLEHHGVDPAIVSRWLAHNESLRHLVTGDRAGHCDEVAATKRIRVQPSSGRSSSGT